MTASAERHPAGSRRSALGNTAAWAGLGLAGSVLLTLTGSHVGERRVTWWFDAGLGASKDLERVFFYLGVGILILAWVGLRPLATAPRLTARQVSLISALWCLPLAIGIPLFSGDVYSYLAQGTIAHLGLNPYHAAPTILARHGQAHVLSAVDPFWRHETAPYGPLFVGVISLIVAVTGSHLVAGALLIRAFDLVGLVLLAIFVPRIARSGNADPARAAWLAVASPLVLLALVAPAHNDLLMAGLMAAGVSMALERRPLLGIVICALAATVKLPAIVAVAFVAVTWARAETRWRLRALRLAQSAAAALLTLTLVTVITGFGPGWISSGLFSTPARVRLAITPATDISWTIARLLGDVGVAVGFHTLHTVFRAVIFGLSVLFALVLLQRSRRNTLVPFLGLALLGFAIAGPALWPWYLSWGLVLVAAWTPAQRSWLVAAAVVVASVLVKPGGILALPLGSSPVVAGFWLLAGLLLWHRWRRRQRSPAAGRSDGIGSPRSVLVER
jgi:alpha-1,6-mannosyltransferase